MKTDEELVHIMKGNTELFIGIDIGVGVCEDEREGEGGACEDKKGNTYCL